MLVSLRQGKALTVSHIFPATFSVWKYRDSQFVAEPQISFSGHLQIPSKEKHTQLIPFSPNFTSHLAAPTPQPSPAQGSTPSHPAPGPHSPGREAGPTNLGNISQSCLLEFAGSCRTEVSLVLTAAFQRYTSP